ncbi:MAG: hypothetical protein V6Z81_03310 [Parvularculales bacterium]
MFFLHLFTSIEDRLASDHATGAPAVIRPPSGLVPDAIDPAHL